MRVERAAELVARRLTAEVGGAAPDDLVHERVAAEDLVEKEADQIRGTPVDVHPNGPRGRQQPRERLEPWREHVEIVADSLAPTIVVRAGTHDAPIGRPVEPRLVLVRRLGGEGRIEVGEVHAPGEALGGYRAGYVERVALYETRDETRPAPGSAPSVFDRFEHDPGPLQRTRRAACLRRRAAPGQRCIRRPAAPVPRENGARGSCCGGVLGLSGRLSGRAGGGTGLPR